MKLNFLIAAAIAAGGIAMYVFHRPSPDGFAAALADLVETAPPPVESTPPRGDAVIRVVLPSCPPPTPYCPVGEEASPLLLPR